MIALEHCFSKWAVELPEALKGFWGAAMQLRGAGSAPRRFRKRNKDTTSCQNNDTIFLNIN